MSCSQDVSEPPVLAAFGGIAALLLLNVGLAALSRLADINVKANPKAEAGISKPLSLETP